MDNDSLLDLAERIGEKDAADYLTKYQRYPSEDDTNDHATVASGKAWDELERQGAGDMIWEGCIEAWRRGYLGPRA